MRRLFEARKLVHSRTNLDVGSGEYPFPGSLTVDVDPIKKPDRVASILDLPFPDMSFDSVTALEVIEHLHRNEQRQAVNELKRVLKRGGRLVVSIPNSSSFMLVPQRLVWWFRERTTQRRYYRNRWTHTHIGLMSPKELLFELKGAGFTIIVAKRVMLYDYIVAATY